MRTVFNKMSFNRRRFIGRRRSAYAQETAPVFNAGDTAWILASAALVMLMTAPGLPFSTVALSASGTCCRPSCTAFSYCV